RLVRDAALPVVITGSADHSCQGGQKSVRQLGERRRAHVLAGTRHRSPLSKTFRSHDYTSPAPQKAVAQVTSFAPVRPATQTGMVWRRDSCPTRAIRWHSSVHAAVWSLVSLRTESRTTPRSSVSPLPRTNVPAA